MSLFSFCQSYIFKHLKNLLNSLQSFLYELLLTRLDHLNLFHHFHQLIQPRYLIKIPRFTSQQHTSQHLLHILFNLLSTLMKPQSQLSIKILLQIIPSQWEIPKQISKSNHNPYSIFHTTLQCLMLFSTIIYHIPHYYSL